MDQINLNKKVYAKNQYERVIDTNFSQLANTNPSSIVPTPTISVSEFFQNYTQIFFQIPKEGETDSHEYLIKTSSEYINANLINNDIQALIDEINILQQQNLELNRQIIELQSANSFAQTTLTQITPNIEIPTIDTSINQNTTQQTNTPPPTLLQQLQQAAPNNSLLNNPFIANKLR